MIVLMIDPFGNPPTSITYDGYRLLITEIEDAIGNVVAAESDYRMLAPKLITDPNGNRTEALFDARGMVIATAVKGKTTETLGDELDPEDLTKATTWLEYDLDRWMNEGKPVFVHTSSRETHGPTNERWLETYSYSDGSGHEAMKKVQAEPGDAPARDESGALVYEDGELMMAPVEERWVGTGRTVLDNKGNPIKKYEPFFSATYEYETDDQLAEWGVTPILKYDPVGRLVRTDMPNGTFSRVEFDAWKQVTYDENDTVLEEGNLWYAARQPEAEPEPSAAEQRAASLAHDHANTPTVTHVDPLGRPFLVVQDNGGGEHIATRTVLDIEGNARTIVDALERSAMAQEFDMLGTVVHTSSIDAGDRWMLTDVLGTSCRKWDSLDRTIRRAYDELRRPTHLYVQEGEADEVLAELVIYGEGIGTPTVNNHRGRVYEQHDGAGRVRFAKYDFKANVVEVTRQLAKAYVTLVDWSTDEADDLAEAETFTTKTEYDALNRPTTVTMPDGPTPDVSVKHITYNEAALLEHVEVNVRGAESATTFVDDIAYNAKGQREAIVYGNVTTTEYTYDELTFRLTRILTTKAGSPPVVLQDLRYTYDPVGNVVAIEDEAQQSVFFESDEVSPNAEYEYDAIYRLTQATGREHISIGDTQLDQNGTPIQSLPHPNDGAATRNYEEDYEYDKAGNILSLFHGAGPSNTASWTREYTYVDGTNRLDTTSVTDGTVSYTHDAHGNMTVMPHLSALTWDFKDQMRSVDKGDDEHVYFTYDAAGQRVRKVWVHSGLVEERIYLGGYEVYRRSVEVDDTLELQMERQTLHVMGETRRIAMVETLTVEDGEEVDAPEPRFRFQLDNHLGSAMLEVDGTGAVISYEEYHPYGTTAYWAAASGIEVSQRRYRYTGQENDEETGLYYHGARYYAPWLGSWTSADPAGVADGLNLYSYCRGNPVIRMDPQGMASGLPNDVNESIGQMTDVQLHRHLKSLSADELTAFEMAASENFAARVTGTIDRGKMTRGNTLPEVKIEGTVSRAPHVQEGEQHAPATPPLASAPTCRVKDIKAEFREWHKEWPDKEGRYTVQLPVKFTVELEAGVSRADCLVFQERKGVTLYAGEFEGDPTQFRPDLPPGAREAKPLWTGEEWTGGDLNADERADWSGQTATFYDAPGFWRTESTVIRGGTDQVKPLFAPGVGIRTPAVVKSAFPLLMLGGTTADRFFRLRTYVADKKSNERLRELNWGLRIEAKTPAPEDLKYEQMGNVP